MESQSNLDDCSWNLSNFKVHLKNEMLVKKKVEKVFKNKKNQF